MAESQLTSLGLNIGDLSTLSSAELKISINKSRNELFTKSYTSNIEAAERLKTGEEETNKLVELVKTKQKEKVKAEVNLINETRIPTDSWNR